MFPSLERRCTRPEPNQNKPNTNNVVSVNQTWGLFVGCAMLLKRAQSLAKSLGQVSGNNGEGRSEKRLSPADFSLSGSELTRVISWHIGRGTNCGLLQSVANAAVREAGAEHVSRSGLVSVGRMLLICWRMFSVLGCLILFAYSNKAHGGLRNWELLVDDPTI